MLENATKYDYDHFANIFSGKKSVSIAKNGSHACTVFPDGIERTTISCDGKIIVKRDSDFIPKSLFDM